MALASIGVEPTPDAIAASVQKEQIQEAACVAYLLARLTEERRSERLAAPSCAGGVNGRLPGGMNSCSVNGAGVNSPGVNNAGVNSAGVNTGAVNGGSCPSPRLKAVTLPLIKWTLRCEIPGHANEPLVSIADVRAPDGTPWEVNTAGGPIFVR
jgi:hypothetical protein